MSDQDPPPPPSAGDQPPPLPGAGEQQPPLPGAGEQQPPLPGAGEQPPPLPTSGDTPPPLPPLAPLPPLSPLPDLPHDDGSAPAAPVPDWGPAAPPPPPSAPPPAWTPPSSIPPVVPRPQPWGPAPAPGGAPGWGAPPSGPTAPPGWSPPPGGPPPPGSWAAPGMVYAGGAIDHPQGTTILVCGIIGVIPCCGIFGLGAAIAAWVMGSKALREIDERPDVYTNRGQVRAGWICGIIGSCIYGLLALAYAAFFLLVVLRA